MAIPHSGLGKLQNHWAFHSLDNGSPQRIYPGIGRSHPLTRLFILPVRIQPLHRVATEILRSPVAVDGRESGLEPALDFRCPGDPFRHTIEEVNDVRGGLDHADDLLDHGWP